MRLRTMLFTPANKKPMVDKANTLGADALILDLEDSVPLSEKETARNIARDAVKTIGETRAVVFVRVNALATGLTTEDLRCAVQPGLAGIVLPKTESETEIQQLVMLIEEMEKTRGIQPGRIVLIPLLESAVGVLDARQIATASPRVAAIAFGAIDFARDLGLALSPNGTESSYARSYIALVARAAGVRAIDSVWVDIPNHEGLVEEARKARQLGFRGKLVIHPSQIEAVNQVFTPLDAELGDAERVVSAFEQAQEKGLAAISLDGKMIDTASYRQAKELLAWGRQA